MNVPLVNIRILVDANNQYLSIFYFPEFFWKNPCKMNVYFNIIKPFFLILILLFQFFILFEPKAEEKEKVQSEKIQFLTSPNNRSIPENSRNEKKNHLLYSKELDLEEASSKSNLIIAPEYLLYLKNPMEFSFKPFFRIGTPLLPFLDYYEKMGFDLFFGIINLSLGGQFKNPLLETSVFEDVIQVRRLVKNNMFLKAVVLYNN
jgi:hypothetical protein